MQRTIELIEFRKLNEDAQDKVIGMWVQNLIDTTDFTKLRRNSKLYKAYKECERMQTPWFLGEYVYEYCEPMIMKICKQYLYTADGEYYMAKEA